MRGKACGLILVLVGMVLVWLSGGAAAQSLFQAAAPGPGLAVGGTAPLLGAASAGLRGGRGPLVEAKALALTDHDGLRSRRLLAHPTVPVLRSSPYQVPSAAAVRAEARALRAAPPRDFSNETSLVCLAVSIYHEARNQVHAGQAAVASVILTRAANPERWGMTPCEVVVPVQFSYLTPDRRFAPITEPDAWATAVEIAAEMLLQGPDPHLEGADHYHATYVDPSWNRAMRRVEQIQDHIFWKAPTG